MKQVISFVILHLCTLFFISFYKYELLLSVNNLKSREVKCLDIHYPINSGSEFKVKHRVMTTSFGTSLLYHVASSPHFIILTLDTILIIIIFALKKIARLLTWQVPSNNHSQLVSQLVMLISLDFSSCQKLTYTF